MNVHLDFSDLQARLRKPGKPVAYWADRAVEISKLLGTHRTRWFRLLQGKSNADCDMYLEWAKDAAERAKKPVAMFQDRIKDPKKYVTPFQH